MDILVGRPFIQPITAPSSNPVPPVLRTSHGSPVPSGSSPHSLLVGGQAEPCHAPPSPSLHMCALSPDPLASAFLVRRVTHLSHLGTFACDILSRGSWHGQWSFGLSPDRPGHLPRPALTVLREESSICLSLLWSCVCPLLTCSPS